MYMQLCLFKIQLYQYKKLKRKNIIHIRLGFYIKSKILYQYILKRIIFLITYRKLLFLVGEYWYCDVDI